VCGSCHALVHAETLEQLASSARTHEERGEVSAARDLWLKALELLPPIQPKQSGFATMRSASIP